MNRPILLVTAIALTDTEGRVLLAQRPEGKHMAGLWEFPGGKVTPGETPEDALIREAREELAIDIKAADLEAATFASHSYEEFHLLMPLFLCRIWRGEPTALEHQKLVWALPRDFTHYPMPPADVPLASFLKAWL